MSYGSYAICGPSMSLSAVRDEVLTFPGVHRRYAGETPIFNGTLDEWADLWKKQFTVHPEGAYITI